MLVLSRRPGERITIGNDIVITVLEMSRGKARIGIEAPMDINVRRSEISERKDMAPDEFAVEWASLGDFCDPKNGSMTASGCK